MQQHMPRYPRRPMAAWPMSTIMWPAGPVIVPLYLYPCTWGCTWNLVFISGSSTTRNTLKCCSISREGQWSWWKVWSTSVIRTGWGSLGMLSLERRSFRADFIALYIWLKGGCRQVVVCVFSQVSSDRTKGNGFKLLQGNFRIYIMKNFFI